MPSPQQLFDLTGRVAVVTGGTRGLGRAIVDAFAEAGATVLVSSRKPDACEQVAAELRERGHDAVGHACHVADWDQVDALAAFAAERFGRVDILVNNAGLAPLYDRPSDVGEALWDKVMGVNLKGPFRLSALIGEQMARDGGGSIINISSIGSVRPTHDILPYAAAKAGLNALTVAYADALGPSVRVNCILPGPFLTDISAGWNHDAFAERAKTFPLRRAGEAHEIVGAALYFASDASTYTTGSLLVVDGGAQWSLAGGGAAADGKIYDGAAGGTDVTERVLAGQTAIVAGASSGIGARFAEVLADAGARVYAGARRIDRLEALAARTEGIVPVACDVTDAGDRDRLVQLALDGGQGLQVCVNVAGIGASQPAEDLPIESLRQVLQVNVEGLFGMCQAAARAMFEGGGGSIVNVGSMFGLVASGPVPDAAYSASKSAVTGLTRDLAAQWADRDVRVNTIAPGWFETEMTEALFADERAVRWLERNCPMGRPGRPDELDGVLLFLATGASSYCTGQTIVIDGGWTLR